MTPDTQMTFGVSGYLVKHALLSNTVVPIPDICNFSPQKHVMPQFVSTKKRVNCDKKVFQVQLINIERVFSFTNHQIDPHLRIGIAMHCNALASVSSFLLCGGIRWRWRWLLSMNRIESLTIFATRSRPERGCYFSQNYDYAISFNI